MRKDERLAGADVMRAAACLLVLIHHLVLRIDFSQVDEDTRAILSIARFGSFGVAIFFVLSGYLLARPFWIALDEGRPMPDLRTYFIRRAARLLPGFWLALTVGFILSVTLLEKPLNAELLARFAAGFLLMSQWHWLTFFPVEGNGPLWSIPFEATCYVLLPLIMLVHFRLFGGRSRFAGRAFWLVTMMLVLLLHWLIVQYIEPDTAQRGWRFGIIGGAKEWMPRYNPIGFFAIFSFGILAAAIETWLPRWKSGFFDIFAACALAFAAVPIVTAPGSPWEAYGMLGIPYDFPYFPAAVAASLVLLSRSRCLGPVLDNPVSRSIATISFGIYIWQDPVISSLKTLHPAAFGAVQGDLLNGWLLWSLLATALVLLAGLVSYFAIERPVLRWVHSRYRPPETKKAAPKAAFHNLYQ